jgi:hypothetical protein
MGICHCWSHAGGSNLVFPKVVPRTYLGSNERICSRYGSIIAGASVFLVRWFVSPYPIYRHLQRELDALTDTKKEERARPSTAVLSEALRS